MRGESTLHADKHVDVQAGKQAGRQALAALDRRSSRSSSAGPGKDANPKPLELMNQPDHGKALEVAGGVDTGTCMHR